MAHLPIGFIKERGFNLKRFDLHDPKADIEVIYSGETIGSEKSGLKFLEPNILSEDIDNVPFLTLNNLIYLKILSNIYGNFRDKDADDIRVLIDKNKLPENFMNNERTDVKERYGVLWSEANSDEFIKTI